MSTMRFADEIVPQSDIDALPARRQADAKELKLASQIIDSLATDWDPERYHDTYTEELRDLIDRKAKGEDIVVEAEAPAEAAVVDLMAALEASLAAARKGGGSKLAAEVEKVAGDLAAAAERRRRRRERVGCRGHAERTSRRAPAKKTGSTRRAGQKRAPARRRPVPGARRPDAGAAAGGLSQPVGRGGVGTQPGVLAQVAQAGQIGLRESGGADRLLGRVGYMSEPGSLLWPRPATWASSWRRSGPT